MLKYFWEDYFSDSFHPLQGILKINVELMELQKQVRVENFFPVFRFQGLGALILWMVLGTL